MEAIILAGGLGTRLQSVIGAYPKCMAPVNGKPFLHYLFQYLQKQGCSKVMLSLGFKHEIVLDWIWQHPPAISISHVIEESPLGTGGGIRLAAEHLAADNPVVLNGDTLFHIDLSALLEFHRLKAASVSLALKPMLAFERYGAVTIGDNHSIRSFEEKRFYQEGLINGGVYVLETSDFLSRPLPEKFSFEKEYLEAYVEGGNFYGKPFNDYFIDIGIPEDYSRVQEDFKTMFP